MAGSGTFTGQSLVVLGTATITSFSVTTQPYLNDFWFNDATSPGTTMLMNNLWPTNYVDGSGLKDTDGDPTGIFSATGLVLMTEIPGDGVFVVGWL